MPLDARAHRNVGSACIQAPGEADRRLAAVKAHGTEGDRLRDQLMTYPRREACGLAALFG
jgi:hypothetical protein